MSKVKEAHLFSKRSRGDVEGIVTSNELALRILNCSPKKGLKDMCRDGLKWIINNPNVYN